MPKTFLWKFTFLFWVGFFLVNIPMHFFGVSYVKDILKTSEEEKLHLMLHTLKPIIALNISFEQDEQLYKVFENILQYEYIDSVELDMENGKHMHLHPHNEHDEDDHSKLFSYSTSINDPFEETKVATITLRYVNTYLVQLNEKVLYGFFFMFVLATIIFFLFFLFFLRKDLEALRGISQKLSDYLHFRIFKPIEIEQRSEEINTIVNVVNDVIEQNANYVKVLQAFNTQLEEKVTQKVEELKQQEELMIHQSRQAAMGEMLESIAHQWRQPLNIIGLSTVKLDFDYKLGQLDEDGFTQIMETISANIEYMSKTIDDFRKFIDPNQEKVYFYLEKSFEESLKVMGAQLKNNSIVFEKNIDPNLKVFGSENEFLQVLLIMINNSVDAIKSQKKKGIQREFKIAAKVFQDGDQIIINFSDNGGGIGEDIISSIFDAYFSTKFASQGTGIGLYIVKNIIQERMHGMIDVKNIEDGCCFSITLPFERREKGR